MLGASREPLLRPGRLVTLRARRTMPRIESNVVELVAAHVPRLGIPTLSLAFGKLEEIVEHSRAWPATRSRGSGRNSI